ncbi:aldehyde oxidase [Sulfurifustis variabilis]|uniref:Aldehyde oxidase n=1 Tax=Sulfurifustis variabilis TaxID=1675686 RepID=A0A1B4V2A5_9GAMM|nr:molybdopterin cofactor-binding domain-containing protein [Sulfurifustis variabilis]BAU47658.1 aldehyde oxidase [Sulfurifustis variabilis]
MISVTVNGTPHRLSVDPEKPLLWILRDELGLKGTKYGCGVGVCGICTVHLNRRAARACMVPAAEIDGADVLTVEGLAARGHRLIDAWIAEQVPQCGYCQPGQLMAAAALLEANARPAAADVAEAMDGVLCRCGTYLRIGRAIARAVAGDVAAAAMPAGPRVVDPPEDALFAPNPWIRIGADGAVTLVIDRSEMGQGVVTGLATLIAEELEVDLEQVRIAFAPASGDYANPRLGSQMTGGSTSVRAAWEALRVAGAGARETLIRAAARTWEVAPDECFASRGAVVHRGSGRRLSYGALASRARGIRPARKRPPLKTASQYRFIGRSSPRLEIPDLVTGRAVFGGDITVPGMRVALVARCPVFGGRVASFDSDAARAVSGVRDVLEIEEGVAVLADDFWSAWRGRGRLSIAWSDGDGAALSSALIRARFRERAQTKGRAVRRQGNVTRALGRAARRLEARYETPYLAHATMEPMNCTARVTHERCDVWVPTQAQTGAQETAMAITGLPAHAVHVHTTFLGGGFGRRQEQDFVAEAVRLARASGTPVQVWWTRADDLQHDFYRPGHLASLVAGLDGSGMPCAWHHRIVGPELVMNGIDLPYAIPHVREEHVVEETAVPVGAWRSVGASQNAFAIECFLDELADAAGRDPLDYRLALLGESPRHRGVLELAAREAGWGRPPAGRHQGIAVYRSFGSWVAQVAEVSVAADGIRVHRVTCALDCGTVVHPDLVRAQMEGAVAFALSAALHGEIRIENGAVQAQSFHDYPIVRWSEMPEVDVHFVGSDRAPGGVGEPGVPPLAPAVANAVWAATRRRLRALPLRLVDGAP